MAKQAWTYHDAAEVHAASRQVPRAEACDPSGILNPEFVARKIGAGGSGRPIQIGSAFVVAAKRAAEASDVSLAEFLAAAAEFAQA